MRALLLLVPVLAVACGDAMLTGPLATDGGEGDDTGARADAGASALPESIDACANADCWKTELAISICGSNDTGDDFSSGNYNAHSYRAVLWDNTPTRLSLQRELGQWSPVLVINDIDGNTLYDGSVGLEADGIRVEQLADANAELVVELESERSMGIEIIVTDRATLDSGFVDRVDADASYTLRVSGDCGVAPGSCVVNGHEVGEPECSWLHFIGRRVAPRMAGTRNEQLTQAARVAWWSLKEGVLSLSNPLVYSNCSVAGAGDVHVGPFETCAPNRAWQVGLAGMQAAYLDTATVEMTAATLYPDETLSEVLARAAQEAGLGSLGVDEVVNAGSTLRRSWLLRDSRIGFHHQAPVVTRECIDDTKSWCFGSGWFSTARFAPTRSAAMQSIGDIHALFEALNP